MHAVLALAVALAQQPVVPADPTAATGCAAQFTWATAFVAENYAGFEDKVNRRTRVAYDSVLAATREAATAAATDGQCDAALRRWLAFFRDGHISISRRQPEGAAAQQAGGVVIAEELRARFAAWPRLDVSEADARARLEAAGAARDPLEGIYESSDGTYRVAVLRDARPDRDFTMTILRADSAWWMPGQVKAEFSRGDSGTYRTRFYMRDHSEQPWGARVVRNLLIFSSGSVWTRRFPSAPDDVSAERYRESLNIRFAAREVAPGTVLVNVPTFGDPRAMDSLWAAEGARIRAAGRLVVDVRGNGGGSDYNFRHFLPLMYTRPVRMISNMALATPANVAAEEALAADTTIPAGQREQLRRNAERMRRTRGRWLVNDDRTTTFDSIMTRPARIDIVTDRGCASSCEQFLLAARQSDKVRIYGDRTAGILDYGNVRTAAMPGTNLVLHRPITRSKRVDTEPIDNIGIPPHLRVPDGEPFPLEWVLRQAR